MGFKNLFQVLIISMLTFQCIPVELTGQTQTKPRFKSEQDSIKQMQYWQAKRDSMKLVRIGQRWEVSFDE